MDPKSMGGLFVMDYHYEECPVSQGGEPCRCREIKRRKCGHAYRFLKKQGDSKFECTHCGVVIFMFDSGFTGFSDPAVSEGDLIFRKDDEEVLRITNIEFGYKKDKP